MQLHLAVLFTVTAPLSGTLSRLALTARSHRSQLQAEILSTLVHRVDSHVASSVSGTSHGADNEGRHSTMTELVMARLLCQINLTLQQC